MTRVLHLSVVHKPDDPRIYERECRTLAEAGYEVMYMVPGAEPGRDDAGVILAPLPERGRSTRFLSSVEITRALRALRPDVLHVHDPELLTLFPAARAFVPRLVYDMHEYVPEAVAGKPYIPAKIRPAASQTTAVAQKSLAALGSGVVVVTEDQLEALAGTPKLRLVLPNYPRVERFEGAAPVTELAADPRLKLIYVGSLSRARGCTMMLDVMEQVEPDEAVLYLGGTFNDPALELEVAERLATGLADRVKLLGRVPPPELPRYLAAADVVWVPSQPDRQYSHPTVPTKLLEGMTMGLAALVSNMPGRGELVRLEECGLAVEPGAAGHLRGLRRLLMNRRALPEMGARGRRAVERRYSWEAVQGDLVDFYGSLCAGTRLTSPRAGRKETPHVSIERFDNVLVLAPHTDDGEFGCGGTMARLIESGVKVTYAAFSTAAKSVPDGFPKDVLKHRGPRRDRHPRHRGDGPQGLRLRGPHLPDHAPGHPRGDDRPAAASSTRTACCMPALIDLHQDHKTIAEEGLRAFKRTTVMAYEIPWNNLNFSSRPTSGSRSATSRRRSRRSGLLREPGPPQLPREDYIRNVALTRGINIGCEYAEVFEVYRWIL